MAEHHSRGPVQGGYEKRDIHVGKVAFFAVILVVVMTMIGVGASFLAFRYLERATESEVAAPSPLHDLQQPPPEPRLLPQPWRNMAEIRAAGERQLQTYGWIDQQNGIVRMPIERAMDLLAQRGLAARPDGLIVAAPAADSAQKMQMGGKK